LESGGQHIGATEVCHIKKKTPQTQNNQKKNQTKQKNPKVNKRGLT